MKLVLLVLAALITVSESATSSSTTTVPRVECGIRSHSCDHWGCKIITSTTKCHDGLKKVSGDEKRGGPQWYRTGSSTKPVGCSYTHPMVFSALVDPKVTASKDLCGRPSTSGLTYTCICDCPGICPNHTAWGGKCTNGELPEEKYRYEDNHCGSCTPGWSRTFNKTGTPQWYCKADQTMGGGPSQTTKNGVAPSTNAICTVTTGSSSKPLRTWKPIEVDCPKKGGKPTVAMVTFNMGGVKGKISAVQISMAASLKSGGASGLAVSMKKSTSTTPNTQGKLNNGLCSGALTSSKKVCDATSYNADGESKVVEYISVWNTGGCTGKVIVEASISEFKDGQKSSCLGKLAVLGGPRSGNADDLYCNIGSVSSCSTLVSYSDVLCGSIKAGYQCMAVKTISSTFLGGRCVANALTCEPKGAACATKPVGSESCQVCNSNDCFGDDVLNPVSEGGINKVAMSILAFAIAANLISP